LGYAMEATLKLRRAPFSTPALVGGKRPAPRTATAAFSGTAVQLTYDESASQLQYTITPTPAARHHLLAVWLHSGTTGKPGAARHQLFAAGQAAAGSVSLSAADRKDAAEGRLLVRFYLPNGRGSAADVPVEFGK